MEATKKQRSKANYQRGYITDPIPEKGKNGPRIQRLLDKLEAKKPKPVDPDELAMALEPDFAHIPNLRAGHHPTKMQMVEQFEIKMEKKRKRSIAMSPDIDKLQEVRIDKRTSIFIDPSADPAQARVNFLEKLSRNVQH
jgi:hypothetical protein